jgi:two-component system NtrC family response regulator
MLHDGDNLPGMVGRHPAMRELYRQARIAARADLPVLIVGETGTGKELVARALHELSEVSRGPFVDLNCAAVPETLAEAQLFGAERGGYTGAVRSMPGLLERADGGTLFLDEACSLCPAIQAKLLRALELKVFWRLGGQAARRVHFRLVTAVARPADDLVAAGAWRPDFAHRVAGYPLTIPPLRARLEDLEALASHFLQRANRNGGHAKSLAPEALQVLRQYPWPGNVRQLRMLLERLAAAVPGPVIAVQDVLGALPAVQPRRRRREELEAALEAHGWDVARTARALRLGRSTLYELLHRYGLRRPAESP